MLYFDHNATSPLSESARLAWLEAHARFIGNPASQHRLGQRAEVALDGAREVLAGWIGASGEEIIWTGGATEAANAVLYSWAQKAGEFGEVWVSAVEHPCVLEAAERWFPRRVTRLKVGRDGVLDLADFEKRLASGPSPFGVAVMAANNETGVIQPWEKVAGLCREKEILMLCDATQWVGRLPGEGLGICDFVLGSGHKFGAPVGVGFLRIRRDVLGKGGRVFPALLVGGQQEEGRRAGTQNVAGVLALVAALRACVDHFSEVEDRLKMRQNFEAALRHELKDVEIVGEGASRLWNTVDVVLPELADCRQRWVVRLDAAGVSTSSGSACASGKEKGSHVLAAMGLDGDEMGRTVRLSSSWQTTAADWEEVIRVMLESWQRWGKNGF